MRAQLTSAVLAFGATSLLTGRDIASARVTVNGAGFKGAAAVHPCAGGITFLRNMDSLHENWSEYPFHMRPGQGSGFRFVLPIAGPEGRRIVKKIVVRNKLVNIVVAS